MIKEDLLEIGKLLQERCNYFKEIDSLTEQAQEAFGRNDTRAAAAVLSLRGEQMEQADICMEQMDALRGNLTAEKISALDRLMRAQSLTDEALYSGFSEEEKEAATRIAAVVIRSRSILKETIRKDRMMNQRIAGKHTFYQEKD